MNELTKRRQALSALIAEYETMLGSTIKYEPTFDITRLPDIIQDLIKYTTAKAPAFSNIAACASVSNALSHIFGQTRPYIDDLAYTSDKIGVNSFFTVISGSG